MKAFAEGQRPVRISAKVLARGDEVGELWREFAQMAERLQRLLDDQNHHSAMCRTSCASLSTQRRGIGTRAHGCLARTTRVLDRIELETKRFK